MLEVFGEGEGGVEREGRDVDDGFDIGVRGGRGFLRCVEC